MKLPAIESTFAIAMKGDTLDHEYTGTFTVRCILTKREELIADVRRRELLGPSADSASPVILNNAYVLGQLFVRIVDAPDWWKESDGGADLYDTNVIGEIYAKVLEASAAWRKKVAGESDKAEEPLRKLAKKAPAEGTGPEAE